VTFEAADSRALRASDAFKVRHLRYFVAVAEEGQMTAAAQKLHLAQPVLSQAIARLERQLGVDLLRRNHLGVTLTPAGEALLAKARAAIEATDDAALEARSLARAGRGVLRFGFVGIPPSEKAPELFARFHASHAGLEIAFRELGFPSPSTVEWLADVDIALCFSPTPHPDVEICALRAEPRLVLVSQEHRLADCEEVVVADVLDETYLGFHPSVDPTWAGFWKLDDHRGKPPERVTPDEPSSAWELVALIPAGRGIATIARSSATLLPEVIPGLAVIPLSDANPAVLALSYRKDTSNPLVNAFVALAQSPRGMSPRSQSA
jgi:DNA-binding transcriptional LysR family regulator